MNQERMQILEMIEAGHISTEEAVRLLDALNGVEPLDEEEIQEEADASPADVPDASGFWLYPVIAGAVVMTIGAPLIALGLTRRAAIFWALCCGWVPFFIGLAILTLGVWSRNARWFHLRIHNERTGRRTFALSLPLPLTLTAWVLKIVRPFVPRFGETGVDEAILALRDGLEEQEDGQPFYVDVQDDDDGEHVQIYIG